MSLWMRGCQTFWIGQGVGGLAEACLLESVCLAMYLLVQEMKVCADTHTKVIFKLLSNYEHDIFVVLEVTVTFSV